LTELPFLAQTLGSWTNMPEVELEFGGRDFAMPTLTNILCSNNMQVNLLF